MEQNDAINGLKTKHNIILRKGIDIMNQGQGNDYRKTNYNDYHFVYQDAAPQGYQNAAPQGYQDAVAPAVDQAVGARIFVNRVYNWMFCGLMITAAVAWGITRVAAPADLIKLSIPLGIIELIIVFILSLAIRKMSASTAGALFIVYSILNGLTLSPIVLYYTDASVFMAFGSCALMFAATSAFGYVTKMRLDSIGAYCFMALIGILVASIVNIFLGSDILDYVISYAGVAIFVGLTAWDTQKVRMVGEQAGENAQTDAMQKVAIIFALNLYLDFINLFIFLLRIFGRER